MVNELSIVLCGAAGQGVQTVEVLLVKALGSSGYHVFSTKESMSRVRGGNNSTEIRISEVHREAFVDRIDLLVPIKGGLRKNIWKRLDSSTIVLGDREELKEEFEGKEIRFIDVPFLGIAREAGGAVTANSVAAAVLCALFRIDFPILETLLRERFAKTPEMLEKNLLSAEKGYERGTILLEKAEFGLTLPKPDPCWRPLLMDGHKAVSLGSLAGGCNFVTAYPMSPGSGVLAFMAQNASRFEIVVEQVEDEISAVNMVLGAWSAGGRGMATTSGGGFALMEEGISLSGVAEIPLVIHLGQRPGPATGMATRTEQADLELALYAGHGEFPRVLFTPGNAEEAFELSRLAFDWADRYQVPVFILTDEYLLDSIFELENLEVGKTDFSHHFVETEPGYARYRVTESGVSPRGIFRHGRGLVRIDSHEHDEKGHIEEDFDVRERMQRKRMSKLRLLEEAALPPTVRGNPGSKTRVFCWGSTGPIVAEALERLGDKDVCMVHLKQVYPLHNSIQNLVEEAHRIVVVEGNSTGQLARLIRLHTGRNVEGRILNFRGHQFSVEEVSEGLRKFLEGGGGK